MNSSNESDDFLFSSDPDVNYFNNYFDNYDSANQSNYITISDYQNIATQNKDSFKIISYNIRSFNANSDTMYPMFLNGDNDPDCLVLCETWFKKYNCQNINGYTANHITRENRSGGVSIYMKNHIKHEFIPELSTCTETIEICTVRVNTDNLIFFVLAIYRPHSDDIPNFSVMLDSILNNSILRNKNCILLGDININLTLENDEVNLFYQLMYTHHFLPLITKPTRFPSATNQTPSLLDHIWINNTMLNYNSNIILSDFTDHCPVLLSLEFTNQKIDNPLKKIQFRHISESGKSKFEDSLRNFNWTTIINPNLDVHFENFINVLNKLYCNCFPIKIKYIKETSHAKPWLSSTLKKLIATKSKSFKLLQLGLISKESNNRLKNMIKTKIETAKRDFYKNYFHRNRNNIKKNWSMVKQIAGITKNKSKILKLIINDTELTNMEEIVNGFNTFFSSIPKILTDKLPSSRSDPLSFISKNNLSTILLTPVEVSECLKIIRGLKNSHTSLDQISVPIFKEFINFFIDPLIVIINICLKKGYFPNQLKLAKIIPIFKKGDKSDPNNYRPISILPFISKILEKCIHTRLISFLDCSNILSPNQFGFRPGISTSDALLKFMEFQYEALNMKRYSCNIFVDFRKAFDTVNHTILLRKLEAYGIRGPAFHLFENYLKNRRQYVSIENFSSDEITINQGIPQGSILGPLLFLVYVNELPKVSKYFKTILFADDTTFSVQANSIQSLFATSNIELGKFYNWSCANRLSINTEKTYFNIISNRRIPQILPSLILNNRELTRLNIITFLGVKIDEKLKFTAHISHICSKVSRSIGVLNNLKTILPKQVLRTLYYAFIYPYFSYCNIIWASTFHTHLKPIVSLQKKAIRIVNNSNFLAHTLELFYYSKILKIEDIHNYIIGAYMFKNHDSPIFSINHSYNTRHRNDLVPLFQRLVQTQNSIHFAGPIIWNDIPTEIKSLDELHMFKTKLKNHLLDKYLSYIQ